MGIRGNTGKASDYVPNLLLTPHTSISCRLPGRLILTFEMEVVAVFDGFDQIQRFEFESKSTSVVCGTYTASTPPPRLVRMTLAISASPPTTSSM